VRLRVFLVDDEPPARARMRQLLADAEDVLVVGEAADALDARSAITSTRPDVVFLDIDMPQMSGTELAASLPEPRPFIVFATAYDRYAVDAFAVEATDYLLKPITRARLAGTLARVRAQISRRSDLERDLVAATVVQEALLPRTMPLIPGFAAAAITRAARGVGGDFFIAQEVAPDRIVLALGDVSGKGIPASLVASSVQGRLEAVTRHATGTASDIVADVNAMLFASSDASRYATLTYLELNPQTRVLTVINAGHLPGLLITPGAPVQSFASTAPAVGILPSARFPAQHVTMTLASTLVLYSDGVTEAIDGDGEEFGHDRLLSVLERHAETTPQLLCEMVLDAVRRHAGPLAQDDITVLALQRLAH
jgi:serine phosphatase RsbU (regulator of sigma subunit)